MLCATDHDNQVLKDYDPSESIMGIARAIRSTYQMVLDATTGQWKFGRDMIYDLIHVADFEHLRIRKQKLINCINISKEENRLRLTRRGQGLALNKRYSLPDKDSDREPLWCHRALTNKTVTIQRGIMREHWVSFLRPNFRTGSHSSDGHSPV